MLLLNEFPSSMDAEVERRMWRAVESEFAGCAVVMVSQRVVVLDRGSVVEVGDPRVLAQMEGTSFRGSLGSGRGGSFWS